MTAELEITHSPVPAGAHSIERVAARAVVRRGEHLLMLRSRHGDYKFPGGGLEEGETAVEALRRELREECGLEEASVGPLVLRAVEISAAREPGAVFRMISLYYRVTALAEAAATQELDDYERELELIPTWVTPGAARSANRHLLDTAESAVRADLPWLEREAKVLELLEPGREQ